MVAHVPPAVAPNRRGPRLATDPFRYVRRVKGGRYQARPYDEGVRYNLGLFPTPAAAAKAVLEFWWGKRTERPKFVRPVHLRGGVTAYVVIVRALGRRDHLGRFATEAEAAAAAVAHVRATFGLFADAVLRGS